MLKAVPVLVTNYRDAAGNDVNSGQWTATSCALYRVVTCWLFRNMFDSFSLWFCVSKKRDDVITSCFSGGDRSRWQLVRRFFKVDRVSGNTTDISGERCRSCPISVAFTLQARLLRYYWSIRYYIE